MHKLILDMSNLMWRSLLAGKDVEGSRKVIHEGKEVEINSAEFGYENALNSVLSALNTLQLTPKDIVMVFEGHNARLLRESISETYKAARNSRPNEAYKEFERLSEMLKDHFLGLGAVSVHQDGIEADDVIAYLAKTLTCPVTIFSTDGDMVQLISDRVNVLCDGELNKNKYGPFPSRYVTLYKALVGDPSDNIKGAHKFGEKAFLDLYCTFEEAGLDALEVLIREHRLEELAEDVAELKCLQRIIDSKDGVYMSYDLARFYPDKVNTMRKPLQWRAGKVNALSPTTDPRYKKWAGQARIIVPDNYEDAVRWALPHLLNSPFVSIDIETSNPPESDEWLAAKSRAKDKDDDFGVDVFGSELTSLQITFGDNLQYTFYFPVNNTQADGCLNVSADRVREFLEMIPDSKPRAIQNVSFELAVLWNTWGEKWIDNGYHGFIPNVDDTKLMASYVDENSSLGLKPNSLRWLGYEQVDYKTVTKGRKMDQLSATEAFHYGCDDTICTAALYNFYRLIMDLEHTWDAYRAVEIDAAYLGAWSFITGTHISLEKMFELERLDDEAYERAWAVLREYLISKGWAGSVCPTFEKITPANMKEAFQIVTGQPLETQVRTPGKIVALIEQAGQPTLAHLFSHALTDPSTVSALNRYVQAFFKGEPEINLNSPQQIQTVLYQVMGLPVRVRNAPTDKMREAGIGEGTPRTDDLAFQYALIHDAPSQPELTPILKAIQAMKVTETRRKMYYKPYLHVRHWKDGRVHSNLQQSATNTRRYTDSGPNKQQLPKHPKSTGEPARFREVYVPHHRDAVVVSLDFSGQELRVIADYSQDPNMLACYVGDNKKDMHVLTGLGIAHRIAANPERALRFLPLLRDDENDSGEVRASELTVLRGMSALDYDTFEGIRGDKKHPLSRMAKEMRVLGKKTNFTTEYGAQAPKLAETLIIEVDEAQQYIDAKYAAFPRAEEWKREVIAETHRQGFATTLLGARRHLANALLSSNKYEAAKAERQAVNYKIQGSSAEMTKLAMGRMWAAGVLFRYDCLFIGPVHDEVVFSVAVKDLIPFLREVHSLMTQPYATMKVPVVSSISFGLDYGRQIEVGEEVDEAVILKALESIGKAHLVSQSEGVAA